MKENYIDVEYTTINDESGKDDEKDITIRADPISTGIHDICNVVNNLTDSIKEYNICKQQENTKRAEIKARMETCIAYINAEKEKIFKELDNRYAIQMKFIEELHYRTCLSLEPIRTAIEDASKSGDVETVLSLINVQTTVLEFLNKSALDTMDRVILANKENNILITKKNNSDANLIEGKSITGYLD